MVYKFGSQIKIEIEIMQLINSVSYRLIGSAWKLHPSSLISCAFSSNKSADEKVDLFGRPGQAELYRNFRPKYPAEAKKYIVDSCSKRDVYIDWACGSAQLTGSLAGKFKTVRTNDIFPTILFLPYISISNAR